MRYGNGGGFGRTMMLAGITTAALCGLAPARPRPMTKRELALTNPIIPPPKRSRSRKTEADLARIAAAEEKRAWKRQRNLAAVAAGGLLAFEGHP